MKVLEKLSRAGKWVYGDGSVPIQLRIVKAAEIQAVNHLHKTMHEYFYVLEGSMGIDIDGEVHTFAKDDLFIVEPGEGHCVVEMSPDLVLLLLMPPPVEGDKVVLP